MTTATAANLNAAQDYLRRGWYAIPLCWPTPGGECGCGRGHAGKGVGKTPLLGNGYERLRPNREVVRKWWTRWPQANIGLLLEPSGLLVVDLDSEEARSEALRLGLPPGPVVKTGLGEHRYFSANGLAGRTTKRGDSRSFDILAAGYVVAPPSRHRSGAVYQWLLGPDTAPPQEPPQWVVDMLRNGHQAGATLPETCPHVDVQSLRVSDRLKVLILTGGPGRYPSRSEAMFATIEALIGAGYDDPTIASVLLANPIGEKVREQGREWLAGELARARGKHAPAPKPNFQPIERVIGSEVATRRLERVSAATLQLEAQDPNRPRLEFLPLLGMDRFVVKGFAHLLSAFPKTGKTTLLVHQVPAWNTAGLLYVTEESRQAWLERLADPRSPWDNVNLVFALGFGLDAITQAIADGDEGAVIVDTVKLLGLEDENDNALINRTLTPLIALCRNQGKTLILAHHTRKTGGEFGVAAAGGYAFAGMVDVALELCRDGAAPRRRRVRGWGRIIEVPELVYEMQEGELVALGDPQAVALEEVKARLRAELTEEWRKTDDLWGAIGEPQPSKEQVRQALGDMARAGEAERDPPLAEGHKQGKTYRWKAANLTSNDPFL